MPGTGAPLNPTTELDEDALSSEFAKELSMGMESLMREIVAEGKGGKAREEGGEEGTEEERQAKMFKAAWEAMLVEGMNGPGGEELAELLVGAGGEAAPGARDGKSTTGEGAGGFQDKIKRAMDKLKESETNLQVRFC
jgi:peroxin-19